MLEFIKDVFKSETKLTVLIEDLSKFDLFNQIARKFCGVNVVYVHAVDHSVAVLKMDDSNWLKFMRELQSNGLNLRQLANDGLFDKLVDYKKDGAE